MKQFKTIYSFELKGYLKGKAFVAVTVILMVAILGILFFPRIKGLLFEEKAGETKKDKIAILTEGGVDAEMAKKAFEQSIAFSDIDFAIETDIEKLKEGVKSKEYVKGFAIHDLNNYTTYIETRNLGNTGDDGSVQVLRELNYQTALKEAGASEDVIKNASEAVVTGTSEVLGEDQVSSYMYTYIMVFALYMIIVMYGQMVATSVAAEKSSRAMEVLVTSARPTALMFGKVTAACTAGLVQLALIFGSAFAGYQINSSYWEDNFIISSLFNIPAEVLIYMLVFFLLGFILYAVMYGAVGSMATKVEDISALSTPIMILVMIAFFVVITGINTSVNSTVMVVSSYVPFTSPVSMFARVAMGNIAWYEIAGSIAILVVTTIGICIYSAKIYRAGMLHYGKAPSFGEIIKKAKTS